MTKIIPIIIYILETIVLYKAASKDEEYLHIAEREKLFAKRDNIEIVCLSICWILYLSFQSGVTPYLCSITLPYLTISEVCDRLTKMVYVTPYYIFIIITLVLDLTGVYSTPGTGIVMIILFTSVMAKTHLVGGGDEGMMAIVGIINYSIYKDTAEALLMICIMILIASVMQYILAVKRHNMDGFFKMKEPMAFGPVLTFATLILLYLRTFI